MGKGDGQGVAAAEANLEAVDVAPKDPADR